MSKVVKFEAKKKTYRTTIVIETNYNPEEVGNVSLLMDTATSEDAKIVSRESLEVEDQSNLKKVG